MAPPTPTDEEKKENVEDEEEGEDKEAFQKVCHYSGAALKGNLKEGANSNSGSRKQPHFNRNFTQMQKNISTEMNTHLKTNINVDTNVDQLKRVKQDGPGPTYNINDKAKETLLTKQVSQHDAQNLMIRSNVNKKNETLESSHHKREIGKIESAQKEICKASQGQIGDIQSKSGLGNIKEDEGVNQSENKAWVKDESRVGSSLPNRDIKRSVIMPQKAREDVDQSNLNHVNTLQGRVGRGTQGMGRAVTWGGVAGNQSMNSGGAGRGSVSWGGIGTGASWGMVGNVNAALGRGRGSGLNWGGISRGALSWTGLGFGFGWGSGPRGGGGYGKNNN